MKQYDIIFFDLDGTLTDPGEGITNSVMYALDKFGIQVSERSQLYKFIGPPLIESFEKFYGFTNLEAQKAVEYYREYFSDKGIFENKVYEGIEELLKAIKASGKQIILATSKPEEFAVRILEHFHLLHYFDDVAGASMDESRNKKDEVIAYALEKNAIFDKNAVLMVGDRKHDILGAKKCGLDSMGVLYGYGDKTELVEAGATYIVEQVNELFQIIQTQK